MVEDFGNSCGLCLHARDEVVEMDLLCGLAIIFLANLVCSLCCRH